jgi:hypothetical protein
MSKWVVGIVMFYVGLLFLSLVAEQSSSATSADTNLFNGLLQPIATDYSNPAVAIQSLWTDAWQYVKIFFNIVFLWFPDLWVGNWIWFYFFVCFPITVMMIFSIMSMLRGTTP